MSKMLNVNEAAERLRVHPETVRRYLREKLLIGEKRGGFRLVGRQEWRVSEDEIERFKRENPTWGDEE
jgi:DNA-binding transcriptional MerR regulator